MKFSTAKFYRPISLGFYFQQYLFKNVLAISTIIYRSDKWSHGKSKGLALAAEGRWDLLFIAHESTLTTALMQIVFARACLIRTTGMIIINPLPLALLYFNHTYFNESSLWTHHPWLSTT